MRSRNHISTNACVAALVLGILFPAIAMAKPPAGSQGDRVKKDRGQNDRRGPMGSPAEMASQMMAEHDRNQDSELRVDELSAALVAHRQSRGTTGANQDRQRGEGGAKQPQRAQGQRRGPKTGQGKAGNRQRSGNRRNSAGKRNAQGPDATGFAAKLIQQFDKNQSNGLDVNELTSSIEAQRQSRGGKQNAGADSRRENGRAKRDQAGAAAEKRDAPQNQAARMPGQGGVRSRPDAEKNGPGRSGRGKDERKAFEPGTGVVPKRPGQES